MSGERCSHIEVFAVFWQIGIATLLHRYLEHASHSLIEPPRGSEVVQSRDDEVHEVDRGHGREQVQGKRFERSCCSTSFVPTVARSHWLKCVWIVQLFLAISVALRLVQLTQCGCCDASLFQS